MGVKVEVPSRGSQQAGQGLGRRQRWGDLATSLRFPSL